MCYIFLIFSPTHELLLLFGNITRYSMIDRHKCPPLQSAWQQEHRSVIPTAIELIPKSARCNSSIDRLQPYEDVVEVSCGVYMWRGVFLVWCYRWLTAPSLEFTRCYWKVLFSFHLSTFSQKAESCDQAPTHTAVLRVVNVARRGLICGFVPSLPTLTTLSCH